MATQTMTILEEPGNEVKDLPENVMSVGGGVGDEAADVTYSTKPDIKVFLYHKQKLPKLIQNIMLELDKECLLEQYLTQGVL